MAVYTDDINKSMKVIKKAKTCRTDGAIFLDSHLEGPFISADAIDAQNPNYLQKPNINTYMQMVEYCEDVVLSITVAPEVDGKVVYNYEY